MKNRAYKRRSLVPKAAIAAGVVVALLVAGAIATGIHVHRAQLVSVPQVVGMSDREALRALEAAGLRSAVTGSRVSSDQPADGVLSQRPEAGETVAPGTLVELVVSAGTQIVMVPDVIGVEVFEATAELERAGLQVTLVQGSREETSTAVLEMFPSPGTLLNPGDVVRLTIPGPASSADVLLPYTLDGVTVLLDPSPPRSDVSGDPTLEVARRLAALLDASGAHTTLTRNTGLEPPATAERIALTAESTATVFVGLDTLSVNGPGVTVSYLVQESDGDAAALARSFTAALRLPGARVNAPRTTRDVVLERFPGTGVRVCIGDPADAGDAAGFGDPGWADEVARGLYRGLGETFRRP